MFGKGGYDALIDRRRSIRARVSCRHLPRGAVISTCFRHRFGPQFGYSSGVNPGGPRHCRELALLAALLATAVAMGGAELVLLDGRVVRGESVKRDGDVYVLATESGDVTMPADLVDRVKLSGEGETLAGIPVTPPTTEEQLRVLGKAAEFQKGAIDPTWTPTSAFDPGKDVLADGRSTWQKAPIDPTWIPVSAFDPSKDVLADSRSTWQKAPIDSTWTPTDGFRKRGG